MNEGHLDLFIWNYPIQKESFAIRAWDYTRSDHRAEEKAGTICALSLGILSTKALKKNSPQPVWNIT